MDFSMAYWNSKCLYFHSYCKYHFILDVFEATAFKEKKMAEKVKLFDTYIIHINIIGTLSRSGGRRKLVSQTLITLQREEQ